jgi:hypothetical protein
MHGTSKTNFEVCLITKPLKHSFEKKLKLKLDFRYLKKIDNDIKYLKSIQNVIPSYIFFILGTLGLEEQVGFDTLSKIKSPLHFHLCPKNSKIQNFKIVSLCKYHRLQSGSVNNQRFKKEPNFIFLSIFSEEYFLHGKKENFGEYSPKLAFAQLIFPNLINYSTRKC